MERSILINFHVPLKFPYSLGDAIDWKESFFGVTWIVCVKFPYSLGDAIDWKV